MRRCDRCDDEPLKYTVMIDPAGPYEDFEDYDTLEEANRRILELDEEGIYSVVGWTE